MELKLTNLLKDVIEEKDHYNEYEPLKNSRERDDLWRLTNLGKTPEQEDEEIKNLNKRYQGRTVIFEIEMPDHKTNSIISTVMDNIEIRSFKNKGKKLNIRIYGFDWGGWNKEEGGAPDLSYDVFSDWSIDINEDKSYIDVDIAGRSMKSTISLNGKSYQSKPTKNTKRILKQMKDSYFSDDLAAGFE